MLSHIDHIVIVAPTLEVGARYVNERLGVTMQAGGRHPRMATHNLLLQLGPSTYLEVIAPEPASPAPTRPRWFAIDSLAATAPARLTTWVARTEDIQSARLAYGTECGEIEPMHRGTLNWQITIPEDGSLPLDGTAPSLIEWADSSPAVGLDDQGCALVSLELSHPQPARLWAILAAIGLNGPVIVNRTPPGERPSLSARILTPGGLRTL